ncbi:MAG: ABC transporter substrate-binding protein, partial [Syntrophothermus sp.]
ILFEQWNRAYSEELSFYFRKEYEKLGGRITVVKSFSSGDEKGFGQLAKELTENGEDGILSIAAGTDNAMLCQQLTKNGSNVKVYAGLWSMSDDLILNGGKTIERIYLAGVFDNASTSPAYAAFKEKYFSRFHTYPTFGSIFSYEACTVLFTALKECSSFDKKCLADNIIKTARFKGLQQEFKIDQFGDADDRSYILYTVKNGKFIKAG